MKKPAQTLTKNFTDSQVDKIVSLHENGASWPAIAEKLNKSWGLKHSRDVYRGVHRRHSDVVKARSEPHEHDDFTKEALGSIVKTNPRNRKRFFITAVGAAAKLHSKSFESVLSYCAKEKAELILLPMNAHVRGGGEQPDHYDPILKPYLKHFATSYAFNRNIKAVELHLNPQQIQPLTGISRIRGRDQAFSDGIQHLIKNNTKCSLIVAHSKQNMEVKATGNNSVPRIIHTTGSITTPDYRANRIGAIASEDHVLGGLILEVSDDEFYITQIQFNPQDGTFVDKYATRFYPDGKTKQERAEAFVQGDIHPGMESEAALKAWKEVCDIAKPKRVFLHDWQDGLSISHHTENRKITKSLRPDLFNTIDSELAYAQKVLKKVASDMPKDAEIVLVASNHSEHLRKYLEEGRYFKDCSENYKTGHRMVVEILDGIDPLKSRLDPDSRFTWLDRNTDYIVEGTQCGSHGDVGQNGARGSLAQHESVNSSSMTAHTHTPGIYHGAYVVGHSSTDRHGYNNGPSTWLTASGMIYKGGHKQLIVALKSNWRLR